MALPALKGDDASAEPDGFATHSLAPDTLPHDSGFRRRVRTSIKFEDGPDNSLVAVEFEAPPAPTILYAICSTLAQKRISIVDSATRITPRALFQRFQLREADGTQLVGSRRSEIERVFVEALASV